MISVHVFDLLNRALEKLPIKSHDGSMVEPHVELQLATVLEHVPKEMPRQFHARRLPTELLNRIPTSAIRLVLRQPLEDHPTADLALLQSDQRQITVALREIRRQPSAIFFNLVAQHLKLSMHALIALRPTHERIAFALKTLRRV